MNQNKIMFFCVGTGGHVLPVKNIIDELLNSGISKNQIEIVTDNRGSKFLQEVDVKCYTTEVFRSDIGKLRYLINNGTFRLLKKNEYSFYICWKKILYH